MEQRCAATLDRTKPSCCKRMIAFCRNCRWAVVGLIVQLAIVQLTQATAADASGKVFSSPLMAADALLTALQKEDEESLIAIFGESYRHIIDTPDKAMERVTRQEFQALARQKLTFLAEGKNRMQLLIGPEDWPMPIPLVRSNSNWVFATAKGEQEILKRRIGMNELAAIETIDAVIDAQLRYAALDANDNGVLDFAQAFVSQPGERDGLYWEPAADEGSSGTSPLSQFVADAEPYLRGRRPGDPFRGYYFRILKRQGNAARGGASDYIRGSAMVGGFAVVAYPARYEVTGIMSFIANHEGRIYERDLGDKTGDIGATMSSFNPDASWRPVVDLGDRSGD